ncbi:MAG TPA: glycosyltransferase family 4 protein [Planctomycetaceae bacterium]|nr:glycosyltransferase family 4 protein [Planctomycetaceae bacterium]
MPHTSARVREAPTASQISDDRLILPLTKASRTGTESDAAERSPVFGFILVGGALVGAQVRDIRLANELVRRGYPVHVWWAFDRPHDQRLDPAISQRWLFTSSRYSAWMGSWANNDLLGRLANRFLSDRARTWITQNYPDFMDKQMWAIIQLACNGVETDVRLIRRFAAELSELQVTHLLPNLEILALFAAAAKKQVATPLKYLVTFQGYEIYANYARGMGCEEALYSRLAAAVAESDWPAIAVSDAYAGRIQREVGVPAGQLSTIPPGIPVQNPLELPHARKLVATAFPEYRPDLPLISYVGRRDSEKGLDLLLYAVKLLESRGVPCQLAICGPTAFGSVYEKACTQVAQHLRVPVLSSGYVSTELRAALFRESRTVVYPSIHEEPFGMVPVEAMAQGTPVVVPDIGGVASVVQVGACKAGLLFSSWDSGDLADKLQALIEEELLHASLAAGAPHIADHFSVAKLGERVLDHVGLPHWHGDAESQPEVHGADLAAAQRRAA